MRSLNILSKAHTGLSRLSGAWSRLPLSGRIGVLGVSGLLAIALFAPALSPYDPLQVETSRRLLEPNISHWAGTDELGRDVFSRALHGSRISVQVGIVAVSIGLVLGILIGSLSAYRGGAIDAWLMRSMDLLFSFPAILLAIVLIAALGTSVLNATIAIGIIFIPGFARLTRALVQNSLNDGYVEYGRCLGLRGPNLILRQIMPNIWPPLIVQATVALAYAIIIEAMLSFLGLGAQPPDPSWGNMVDGGRRYLSQAPWIALAPSVGLFASIVSLNLLGDAVRQRMDPKLIIR